MIDKLSRKAVGSPDHKWLIQLIKTVIHATAASKRLFVVASLKSKRALYRFSSPIRKTGIMDKLRKFGASLGHHLIRATSYAFLAISAVGFMTASAISGALSPAKEFYHRHLSERFGRIAAHIRRGKVNQAQAAVCAALVTLIVISVSNFNVALQVTVNGKPVGYVGSENEVAQIISDIEKHSSVVLGKPFHLDADISYSLGITERSSVLDTQTLRDVLSQNIDAIATLAVVSVDGKAIGGVTSVAEAQNILDGITARYIGKDANAKASFLQSVSIDVKDAPAEIAMTPDELKKALSGTASAKMVYTVQPGDTFSEIAESHQMKTSEIMALNPGITPEKLKMGTDICVKGETPLLSVQVVKNVKYTEQIPFSTIEKKNASLPKNKKRVIQQGKAGSASVAAKVTTINGVEQQRTITSRTVMSDCTDQIVEIGTKNIGVGTGSLIRPFGGSVSSNYGYRSGGEFHTGVDFAGPIGSSVVAADSGKVTFSGWNGNYGYCIIIDHGNGLQTLYAHNSRLIAHVGDCVEKGQVISKVGSTGRSTGPHCHFEVRRNGNHVSPWNYIS